MKKILILLTVIMLMAWQIPSFADSSVDELIQKLQDKGILTSTEANQLKGDAQASEQTNEQTTFKTMLPDWVSGLKISGDFRLRDQLQVRDVKSGTSNGDNLDQNRGRFRARLNFEDQINDKVKVIFGLATNGEKGSFAGNDRSNNITFGGNNTGEGTFNKSSVVINKAYAVYTPNENITLMGGQMDNPIWEPGSLLWDPDITPVGGVVQLQKKLNDYVTPFTTTGFFVLKDNTPAATGAIGASNIKTDPYIFVTQDGVKGNLTEKVYYKAAATYYNVSNPTRAQLDNSNSTNTTIVANTGSNGIYAWNYYLVGGAVDLGINDPFGDSLPFYIPQVGVFGQFFRNIDLPSNTQPNAWMIGGYVGNSSLNGWGTWRLQSYYKVLERDSWMDALPDDDFYSGDTDVAGYRSQLDIGLMKNVWFTMSYFRTHIFKHFGTSTYSLDAPEDLFQMDVNMKF